MTYPPGPPSGPGFGGDPNAYGQQPQSDPAWWDQPAQQPGGEYQPQQPGWPAQQPAPGWQQPGQTNWAGPQGYAQQPGFPPPQPPKSNGGLIAGIVIGVIVVVAVAVGAIVFVSKKDDTSQAAVTTTSATTTTDAPTTTRTTAPTTTKAAPAGARFHYTEYGQDWNFKLGSVALQASWVEGHDYNNCAPIEKAGKLTGLGCQTASELVWKSENGGLMLTQLVLGMASADQASSADGQFDDGDVQLPDGSFIADFETGKWKDGNQGSFLVVTVATATAAVDTATVEKYLKYRHSDTLGALAFR